MKLEQLKQLHKWPLVRPDVPPVLYGWLSRSNQYVLQHVPNDEIKVIVELGAWPGKSTLFLCNTFRAATIISIDHWEGSKEHKAQDFPELPVLYETFCANCWDFRDQIIPVRARTCDGLDLLHNFGIEADLVYIDASHEYSDVYGDIKRSCEYFPDAYIVGDDWPWVGVRNAVQDYCSERNLEICAIGDTWEIIRKHKTKEA